MLDNNFQMSVVHHFPTVYQFYYDYINLISYLHLLLPICRAPIGVEGACQAMWAARTQAVYPGLGSVLMESPYVMRTLSVYSDLHIDSISVR